MLYLNVANNTVSFDFAARQVQLINVSFEISLNRFSYVTFDEPLFSERWKLLLEFYVIFTFSKAQLFLVSTGSLPQFLYPVGIS